jgi:hypothetical protein
MKVEHSTPEKPEVFGIAAALNINPDEAFGICFRMWRWFDQHTENGNARSVTPALLDRHLGVAGFTAACVSVGWLVISDAGLSLPHFDRHNGQTAKARGLTYNRVKAHRQKEKRDCNAESVSNSLPENREQSKSIDIPPPPTPAAEKGKAEVVEEADKTDLTKRLRASPFGLRYASTAIESAMSHGVQESEIQAIADYWKAAGQKSNGTPAPWDRSDLHQRILNAMPGENPAEHWPQPGGWQLRERKATR